MAKTVISIEVGAAQTRMAVLSMGKKKQHVQKALIVNTPENSIDDGFISNTGLFAEQLAVQLRNAKITTKNVVFTLSSNKVISREIVITAVKEKLISNIVKAEINEYFPMDISDHLIAYSIIGHKPETQEYRLIVYAAPESLIRCYYTLAEEMGCHVVSIDIAGNSMYQWLKRSTLQDVSLVMQINEATSVLTVIDKEEMGVQRTIGYGSATLADALLESHAYDEITTPAAALKHLQDQRFLGANVGTGDSPEDEAWRKNELAQICESRFRRMEEDEEDEANERSIERLLSDDEILRRRISARDDVLEAARQITANAHRVIEYYTTKNPESAVQKIYVTGSGITIQGMVDMIAGELDLPVEVFNVTEGVSFAKEVENLEEGGAEFLVCFGATIQPLGLKPADAAVKEKKRNISMVAAIIFFAAVAIISALIVLVQLQIASEKSKIKETQALIQEVEYIEQLYQVYQASQASIDTMVQAGEMTFSMGEQLNDIITALEKALPSRSLVQSFSLTDEILTMNFSTVTKEEAAMVLVQLKSIPYISDVQISGIVENVDETTNRTEVVFTVTCKLQRYEPTADNTAEGTEVQ